MRLCCPAGSCVPPAWLCLLLLLLPVQVQSRDTLLRAHRHRLSSSRISNYPKPSYTSILPTVSDLSVAINNRVPQEDRHIIRRAPLHKDPSPKLSNLLLYRSYNVQPEAPVLQRGSRGRRHASGGGGRGHGHLMRVGCVLGTCQVQNLSHRLYQLIGQSGREDYSPINPRSPHSYG
ncbi:protein ADM2 [Cololabis saira]|uniref:protein ADM2 n=1 Tax=Cololabis saira TaxID=129043 RepID=UPI002AD34A08|nr:protein ADM2 [Cololabis saira]